MKNRQKKKKILSFPCFFKKKKKIQKKLYKKETQSFSLEMFNTQKKMRKKRKKNLI
jgi:hypothetical protein